MGIHPIIVTRYNQTTTQVVLQELGTQDVKAKVIPVGKVETIRSLQKDGVYDMKWEAIYKSLELNWVNKNHFSFLVSSMKTFQK